jgi:hypothetical protein
VIVTVSTVKDTLENVQRFVRGNLAGGVDHMIVFLDAATPDVEAWLATQEHVTFVVTDRSWWQGDRPQLLNRRQRLNANLGRAALSLSDWATWVFHIDADEVAQIDRAVLDAVPAHRPAVRLEPREVVSELEPAGFPTRFKRLLGDDELQLLVTLGLLAEPTNSLFYRSHIAGKIGVRPCLDLVLKFHNAIDDSGSVLQAVSDPGLTVLHYESFSGDEFVRKWTNMITSGPTINFGAHRMKIATALRVLVTSDLSAPLKAKYLTQIYRDHMEDPVEALGDLGFLVEVDPLEGTHRPSSLPDGAREQLRSVLEAMRERPKRLYLQESASASDIRRELVEIAPGSTPRLHAATGWVPPSQRSGGKVASAWRRGRRRPTSD